MSATQVNQLSKVPFPVIEDLSFCVTTPNFEVSADQERRCSLPQDSQSFTASCGAPSLTVLGSGLCPEVAPVSYDEQKKHAASLNDEQLCEYLERTFAPTKRTVAYNLPYLAEARGRFMQRGRRIPIAGKPSWSEWISANLGISDRQVRRLLAKYRIETGQQPVAKPSKPKSQRAKKVFASTSKAELNAAVNRKLIPTVETAERYIRVLEALVYSQAVALTDEQRKALQKPMEAWRSILRYARGVQAERTGKAVSMENAPVALVEVA